MSSVLFITMAVYAGLCLSLYVFQSRLIFFPSATLSTTPQAVGLRYEEVRLRSSEDTEIHAWYIANPATDLTVLFCHGNAGNISHRLQTMRLLHELGVNVLIFDYAGYGQSSGQPSEAQLYADARAVWSHLVTDRGLRAEQVVVFGRSLGGGVATQLATEVQAAGLVLESSFTSVSDMGARLYPMFPVRWLVRFRFDNRSKLPNIRSPVMVMHSPDDNTVPFEHGQTLFELATSPKQFFTMSGGHNDGFIVSGEAYRSALRDFFLMVSG